MLRNIFTIMLVLAFLVGCAGIPKETPKPIIQPDVKEEVKRAPEQGDGYTYDGRLDPAMFNHWLAQPFMKEQHGITFAMKNPTKYAAIPFALVYVAQGISESHGVEDGTMVSFAYIEDGKLRFFLNTKGHYKEIDLPSEQADRLKKILEGFVGQ